MSDTFVNPNPETLEVKTIEQSDIGLTYLQNVAVRRLIAIREKMATDAERERCGRVAEEFSTKPSRSIHPDINWDEMSDSAKLVAHTTAQQIAVEIRDAR